MKVSIQIECSHCETKMVVTPPRVVQDFKDKSFDLNCAYCEMFIGSFNIDLSTEKENGDG
ncbi:hypothetical protein [Lysinibacillus sp. NPDC047702]|uniref:hypothetical protein n=1 Tax=unclassified Lysinibacillus TaxID=2636778 RepID=UPI003D079BC8